MDPLSQGVLGAVAAQAISPRGSSRHRHFGKVTAMGWVAGMAPDLDVLIRSSSDPLLYLEYHRQFTHSLAFIPFGSAIVALLFWFLFRSKMSFWTCYAACFAGYATHGFLDACTTYGTQLLWPFSDARVAWNIISIIDPIFTLPLLVLVIWSAWRKSPKVAWFAVAFLSVYFVLGVIQRDRAESFAREIIASRGHTPTRLEAKPSFANILVWKVVYEWDNVFYVDAARMGWKPLFFIGESAPRLDVKRDFPDLDLNSIQVSDIERFRWFSNDYLAVDPEQKDFVIDVRYSMVPNEVKPLWGIRLNPASSDRHVSFEMSRDTSDAARAKFWRMLFP
jgi:inner membrane protein